MRYIIFIVLSLILALAVIWSSRFFLWRDHSSFDNFYPEEHESKTTHGYNGLEGFADDKFINQYKDLQKNGFFILFIAGQVLQFPAERLTHVIINAPMGVDFAEYNDYQKRSKIGFHYIYFSEDANSRKQQENPVYIHLRISKLLSEDSFFSVEGFLNESRTLTTDGKYYRYNGVQGRGVHAIFIPLNDKSHQIRCYDKYLNECLVKQIYKDLGISISKDSHIPFEQAEDIRRSVLNYLETINITKSH